MGEGVFLESFLIGSVSVGGRDPAYAVSPDDKRFLILRDQGTDLTAEMMVTLNWRSGLRNFSSALERL